jgi:hypothetical protein
VAEVILKEKVKLLEALFFSPAGIDQSLGT